MISSKDLSETRKDIIWRPLTGSSKALERQRMWTFLSNVIGEFELFPEIDIECSCFGADSAVA